MDKLLLNTKGWVCRHVGHSIYCPAFKAKALDKEDVTGEPNYLDEEDYIIERLPMIPRSFKCFGFGLIIVGLLNLFIFRLGAQYSTTLAYEASEYFDTSAVRFFERGLNV